MPSNTSQQPVKNLKPTLSTIGFSSNLSILEKGLPGLSEVWGKFLAEAGAVCFELHNHPQGVELKVSGSINTSGNIYWNTAITDQIINSWSDKQELTEFGACGIAILLIIELTKYTVIRRSRKGTGIDYWLSDKDAELPFQDAARLEVSGIFQGDEQSIKSRVSLKKNQTKQSDGYTPAIIIVVEFSKPFSHFEEK